MTIRSKARFLIPVLALGMTLAASAGAQDRQYRGGTSLQITFGSTPHWVGIPGTQVREIRQGDRTDYDMFRYGRNYYAYNNANGRWYTSRHWRGQFRMIADRSVPRELRRIPRNHWRNYPDAWQDRDYRESSGSSSTFQVTYGNRPHWAGIDGTRIEMVSAAERPNYDVFRYGGNYYVYSNDRWYRSSRESGQFMMIDDRSVPTEFSRLPRENWRSYPSGWENRGNSRGWQQGNGRGGN
jgi:hypothetical protein